MSNTPNAVNRIDDVNALAVIDSQKLIANTDARYAKVVESLAQTILQDGHERHAVMLAGPSGAGKTTTAYMLAHTIRTHGNSAFVVSLDNFYRGIGKAPRLGDGSYDYESVEAIDCERLQKCLLQLLETGRAEFPIFDFIAGAPSERTNLIEMGHEGVVIVEGIHAVNPAICGNLSSVDNVTRMFVTVALGYTDSQGQEVLAARDVRFLRRMLRDYHFRNAPIAKTMAMWKQVCRGESLYIHPFQGEADILVDSLHSFEPCVYRELLTPLLKEMSPTGEHGDKAAALLQALERFEKIPLDEVPENSMIREFTGGGIYF